MKNGIKLLIFILSTTIVFFVDNVLATCAFFVLGLIEIIHFKIQLKEIIRFYSKILLFIILTVLVNAIAEEAKNAIMLGFKLITVCNFICIYYKNTTSRELVKGLEWILSPLKIIKVNVEDISIIISIAITFIPILLREINLLKSSLKIKNYKLKINTINIIMKPFLISLLKKIDEIDKILKVKAYE